MIQECSDTEEKNEPAVLNSVSKGFQDILDDISAKEEMPIEVENVDKFEEVKRSFQKSFNSKGSSSGLRKSRAGSDFMYVVKGSNQGGSFTQPQQYNTVNSGISSGPTDLQEKKKNKKRRKKNKKKGSV